MFYAIFPVKSQLWMEAHLMTRQMPREKTENPTGLPGGCESQSVNLPKQRDCSITDLVLHPERDSSASVSLLADGVCSSPTFDYSRVLTTP